MKRFNQTPMNEYDFEAMMGTKVTLQPLIISPKINSSPVFKPCDKVIEPKRIATPRVSLSQEDRRLRKNETQKERMRTIRKPKSRITLTDEERKEYHRNFMREYRKNNPFSEADAKKRRADANPEKAKECKRLESAKYRAKQKLKKLGEPK